MIYRDHTAVLLLPGYEISGFFLYSGFGLGTDKTFLQPGTEAGRINDKCTDRCDRGAQAVEDFKVDVVDALQDLRKVQIHQRPDIGQKTEGQGKNQLNNGKYAHQE